MKKFVAILVSVTAGVVLSPVTVQAQQKVNEHSAHHPAGSAASAVLADGEIRRIDKEAKKITIRHGEIKNLDMPPMTMVFQVADPALLENAKVGDKVKFAAEKTASGYSVTQIQPAK